VRPVRAAGPADPARAAPRPGRGRRARDAAGGPDPARWTLRRSHVGALALALAATCAMLPPAHADPGGLRVRRARRVAAVHAARGAQGARLDRAQAVARGVA